MISKFWPYNFLFCCVFCKVNEIFFSINMSLWLGTFCSTKLFCMICSSVAINEKSEHSRLAWKLRAGPRLIHLISSFHYPTNAWIIEWLARLNWHLYWHKRCIFCVRTMSMVPCSFHSKFGPQQKEAWVLNVSTKLTVCKQSFRHQVLTFRSWNAPWKVRQYELSSPEEAHHWLLDSNKTIRN